MDRKIPVSLARGVGEDLVAPLALQGLAQLVLYGKRLKGVRVQEEVNLNRQPIYSFLSRRGMFKLGIVQDKVRGKLLMSGQTYQELKHDPLLNIFFAAVFNLRLSGTVYVSQDDKKHRFCLKQGEIYKETETRHYFIRNPVWDQFLNLQMIKGQIQLMLENLSQAMQSQNSNLIEQYKAKLSFLQMEAAKLRLWED